MRKRLALLMIIGAFCTYSAADNPRSAVLHDDVQRAYAQLNQITSSLQYIGQVLNQGIYSEPHKARNARLWILEHLDIIKKHENSSELMQEENLMGLIKTMRVFLVHITTTLEKDFARLETFVPPVIMPLSLDTDEQQKLFYKKLNEYLDANDALIKDLDKKVESLGLTTTNHIARSLDSFNEKWRISKILKQVPRYIGFAGLALYLTSYERVKDMWGLGWLKRHIGTSKYLDPYGCKAIKKYPTPVTKVFASKNKTWAGLLRNEDERNALLQYLACAAALYNYGFFTQYIHIDPLKKSASDYWNSLKGFDIKRIGTYTHPACTLDDPGLIGLESQIEIMRDIVRYITEPDKFDRSASGIEKGILFTGPSRTGKTLLANALCGSINKEMQAKGITRKFAFRQVKATDIRWSAEGIKSLIEEAKAHAPCVLFIDEIHHLPLQLKSDLNSDILTQFMTMSEALQSTSLWDKVIVIGATNRAYALDDALLKPGRFGKQIYFEHPTYAHRKKFFTVMCTKNALDPQGFDLESVARQTEGCSYGDLDTAFTRARFRALRQERGLRQEDFQYTLDRDIHRLGVDIELTLTQEERTLLAAHQAGHAFMYNVYREQLHERLETVTIRGRWRKDEEIHWHDPKVFEVHNRKKLTYGHIITSHPCELVPVTGDAMIQAKVILAGHIAEELLLGSTNYSYHEDDTRKALKILEKITFKGLSQEDFTQEELTEPKREAKRLLEKCKHDVRELLQKHKASLSRLAEVLNEKMLLRGDEVEKILENHKK